jgi:hypothetical protein
MLETAREVILLFFAAYATIWAIKFLTGFGLFDLKRQHEEMSSLISRSSRGEKERYQIMEDERKFIFLKILLIVLTILVLSLYYEKHDPTPTPELPARSTGHSKVN